MPLDENWRSRRASAPWPNQNGSDAERRWKIEEMLTKLTCTSHRLRQSDIDEELFDLIDGFEAHNIEEKRN